MLAELLQSIPAEPFPNGISRYAIGGFLVGLGAVVIYLGTGIAAGASTFLESTLSSVRTSRGSSSTAAPGLARRLHAGDHSGSGGLRRLLAGGTWTTDVQPWRLLIGGVLVGIGTRVGKGCTSGHGVCGVGSASRTSIIGVITFLTVAIVTAQIVQAVG